MDKENWTPTNCRTVAVPMGLLSPEGNDGLYAKASFKSESGFSMRKKLGVHQIAAFGN